MKVQGKVATWLDTVAATHFHHAPVHACLHPIAGEHANTGRANQPCYAISVNGKWLCSSNGRITVLRDLKSAQRFLELLNLPIYENGEPARFEVDCTNSAHCMAFDKRGGLKNCSQLFRDHPI